MVASLLDEVKTDGLLEINREAKGGCWGEMTDAERILRVGVCLLEEAG